MGALSKVGVEVDYKGVLLFADEEEDWPCAEHSKDKEFDFEEVNGTNTQLFVFDEAELSELEWSLKNSVTMEDPLNAYYFK